MNIKEILPLFSSKQKKEKPTLGETLNKYGLDFNKLIDAWKREKNPSEAKIKNLKIISKLEKKYPGSVNILYEDFGIKNFYRCPLNWLKKQYEQRNDLNISYGTVLSAEDDYNGSNSYLKYGFNGAWEGLSKGGIATRFIEFGSKYELAKRLLFLENKYNLKREEEKKISFMVGNAHADIESATLSKYKFLKIDDLMGGGTAKARRFFKENCPALLILCNADAHGGIGEVLSRRLGLSVEVGEGRVGVPVIMTEIKEIDEQKIIKFKTEDPEFKKIKINNES